MRDEKHFHRASRFRIADFPLTHSKTTSYTHDWTFVCGRHLRVCVVELIFSRPPPPHRKKAYSVVCACVYGECAHVPKAYIRTPAPIGRFFCFPLRQCLRNPHTHTHTPEQSRRRTEVICRGWPHGERQLLLASSSEQSPSTNPAQNGKRSRTLAPPTHPPPTTPTSTAKSAAYRRHQNTHGLRHTHTANITHMDYAPRSEPITQAKTTPCAISVKMCLEYVCV